MGGGGGVGETQRGLEREEMWRDEWRGKKKKINTLKRGGMWGRGVEDSFTDLVCVCVPVCA